MHKMKMCVVVHSKSKYNGKQMTRFKRTEVKVNVYKLLKSELKQSKSR